MPRPRRLKYAHPSVCSFYYLLFLLFSHIFLPSFPHATWLSSPCPCIVYLPIYYGKLKKIACKSGFPPPRPPIFADTVMYNVYKMVVSFNLKALWGLYKNRSLRLYLFVFSNPWSSLTYADQPDAVYETKIQGPSHLLFSFLFFWQSIAWFCTTSRYSSFGTICFLIFFDVW